MLRPPRPPPVSIAASSRLPLACGAQGDDAGRLQEAREASRTRPRVMTRRGAARGGRWRRRRDLPAHNSFGAPETLNPSKNGRLKKVDGDSVVPTDLEPLARSTVSGCVKRTCTAASVCELFQQHVSLAARCCSGTLCTTLVCHSASSQRCPKTTFSLCSRSGPKPSRQSQRRKRMAVTSSRQQLMPPESCTPTATRKYSSSQLWPQSTSSVQHPSRRYPTSSVDPT